MSEEIDRRNFLKTSALSSGATALGKIPFPSSVSTNGDATQWPPSPTEELSEGWQSHPIAMLRNTYKYCRLVGDRRAFQIEAHLIDEGLFNPEVPLRPVSNEEWDEIVRVVESKQKKSETNEDEDESSSSQALEIVDMARILEICTACRGCLQEGVCPIK